MSGRQADFNVTIVTYLFDVQHYQILVMIHFPIKTNILSGSCRRHFQGLKHDISKEIAYV